MTQRKWGKKEAWEFAYIVAGSALYALAIVWFLNGVKLVPGSVIGIAVILRALFDAPIGLANFLINLPIVVIGTYYLGKKLLVYTGLVVLLTSLFMDWWSFMAPLSNDPMLNTVFGAVMMGIGMGFMLKVGATTGGTSVIGALVVKWYPNIPIGKILLIADLVIIVIGSIMLVDDWNLFLYAVLFEYICVIFIDKVVYGLSAKTAAVVYTMQAEELQKQIQAIWSYRTELLAERQGLVFYCPKKSITTMERFIKQYDTQASCTFFDVTYSFGKI